MTVDLYLQTILAREAVDRGPNSPVRGVQAVLFPTLWEWAGGYLLGVSPSGSFAKGTANRSGTDIDLFISLSETTPHSLKQIYEDLALWMRSKGFNPTRQNVSVNVRVNGYDVDLVPARRQQSVGDDHSLYRRRGDTWMKTNVVRHIGHVIGGGRQSETRILKLWRNQHGIDFPSFYLELTVLAALAGSSGGTLGDRVWRVFQYLRDSFPSAQVIDPANTNNVVSNDLTATERGTVRNAAVRALAAKNWNEIVT